MKPNRAHASFRSPRAGIAGLLVATLVLGAVPAPARAQTTAPPLTLPNIPWFIGQNVPPNILLTIDDSGSMAWAVTPDAAVSATYWNTIAFKSNLNPMYYNDAVDYVAPPDANDVPYTTSYTAARRNGFDATRGTVNLSNAYLADNSYDPRNTSSSRANHCPNATGTGATPCPGVNVVANVATEAYWWTYVPSGTTCPANPTLASWTTLPSSCFTFNRPTTTVRPSGLTGQQNFANWYSFYRTRNLAVVSATMLGFAKMPQDYRIGWQGLGGCQATNFSSSCIGWDTSRAGVNAKIGPYNAAKRQALWRWLERLPTDYGTPLRSAIIRAGEYLKTTGAGSPYADDLSATSGITYTSCRSSYSVALTDGIWNGDTITSFGNTDNTSVTLPDGKTYTPSAPFRDLSSNTLADIAFSYWSTDLQPTIPNTLRQFMPFQAGPLMTDAEYWDPRNDPATWQKMNSIYVGLGLSSWLTSPAWAGSTFAGQASPATGYQQFRQGTANWPAAAVGATPGNVYDLWHAAVNSRGQFYAADSPDSLVKAFEDLRNRISQREAGASAAGGSSLQVQTDAMMFSTSFNSQRWDGTLRAYKVNTDGTTDSSPIWTTDSTFNHRVNGGIGPHTVYTVSGTGTRMVLAPDTVSQLPTARQTELSNQVTTLNTQLSSPITSAGLISWVLGDVSNTELRRRDRLLGDLVNSSPMSEGGRDYGYGVTAWTDTTRIDGQVYADYVKSKHDSNGVPRKPTV
ncbi:MAG: hypothetical protein WCK28_09260, partial [Burkholderiales bacterium]